MTDSPWMTTAEISSYARCDPSTVRMAYVEYRRSAGRRGLKHVQSKANSPCKSHRDDVDRWMAGETPSRGTRKLAQVARSA